MEFPLDINFTDKERSLPADRLFRLLQQQLQWATQDGEQLRAEAELLEKQRKEEWAAKELLVENVLEAELAAAKRRRLEAGETDGPNYLAQLETDVVPAKKLQIHPMAGKTPWWREEGWLRSQEGGESGTEKATGAS